MTWGPWGQSHYQLGEQLFERLAPNKNLSGALSHSQYSLSIICLLSGNYLSATHLVNGTIHGFAVSTLIFGRYLKPYWRRKYRALRRIGRSGRDGSNGVARAALGVSRIGRRRCLVTHGCLQLIFRCVFEFCDLYLLGICVDSAGFMAYNQFGV